LHAGTIRQGLLGISLRGHPHLTSCQCMLTAPRFLCAQAAPPSPPPPGSKPSSAPCVSCVCVTGGTNGESYHSLIVPGVAQTDEVQVKAIRDARTWMEARLESCTTTASRNTPNGASPKRTLELLPATRLAEGLAREALRGLIPAEVDGLELECTLLRMESPKVPLGDCGFLPGSSSITVDGTQLGVNDGLRPVSVVHVDTRAADAKHHKDTVRRPYNVPC
jgi:hypothetical protein